MKIGDKIRVFAVISDTAIKRLYPTVENIEDFKKLICGKTFAVEYIFRDSVTVNHPDDVNKDNIKKRTISIYNEMFSVVWETIPSSEEIKESIILKVQSKSPVPLLTGIKDWEMIKIKERISNITAAMFSLAEDGKSVPSTWISELIGRIDELERYYE